ncbi:MAG: sodium-translocating pyrophosphatase [Deltaproteobacteria bacterium]|nr:MAG: sodium-translocating pyrophosphatase [Deltaproteobacteria bacterium]
MELLVALIASILALVYVVFLITRITKVEKGTEKMIEIADAIHEGAMTFLKREYTTLVLVLIAIAILLGIFIDPRESITFIVGAAISGLAAWVGMNVSTASNVRSANIASQSFPRAFQVAISSGAVMGMCVVGMGLLGVVIIYFITPDLRMLVAYAFGSSLIALFLRVGGGIFTKSADVGADLVGKVEAGIPEDDPRNPAVIADAVGDNVGDIAGMGSDLFESYVSAIVATMFLGAALSNQHLLIPLLLAGAGIICSIIGSLCVRVAEGRTDETFEQQTDRVRKAMNLGIVIANGLMVIASFIIVKVVLTELDVFWALLAGLLCGMIIGWATIYYTSDKYGPVSNIVKSTETGASTVIIEGLAQGMYSTVIPVLAISAAMVAAYLTAGLYGIAVAGVGILGVLGVNLSCDCYGPIVDNAAGIAEMCEMDEIVRTRCDALDSVGNTTAAMGKGFAIGSAALAALAWLAAYYEAADLEVISITEPTVMAGLFIGGLMVFLFAALTMKAVGRGGYDIVREVRRQWKEIPGLMEGTAKPDSATCVDITTRGALKSMVIPGLLSVVIPAAVGFTLGLAALGALLAAALAVGLLVALFMANAGGAWDNAKKYIEAGHMGGKGSDSHKAAVVGDTVGDPFKDTSGPSLNILIKIVGKVALIMVPVLLVFWGKV